MYRDFTNFGFDLIFAAIGFNVETVQYNNIKFQVWDLGMFSKNVFERIKLWIWSSRNDFWYYMEGIFEIYNTI
jgi:hypothetical protein